MESPAPLPPIYVPKTLIQQRIITTRNILIGLLVLAFPLMLGSLMMFDAPGSENNVYLKGLMYSEESFFILDIIALIVSWVCYRMQKYRISLWILFLPMISILGGIISVILLVVMCGGSFVC